jgi:RNA ligase
MLPNYQDCLDLCNYANSPFYETKLFIDGFPISLFNYRLASNQDFERKFAKELRGICFVFNTDGSLFKRFILLDKFFNLNQVKETSFDVVKNYQIKSINNKEDGSLATFIKLPNGKVVAKSKMGFDNEQAKSIDSIYQSDTIIKELVNFCLDSEIVPVFEYVSPFNRIVLKYKSNDLVLLKLRCNLSGRYLDFNTLPEKFSTVNKANTENEYSSLEELVDVVVNLVHKEGVVVHCINDDGKDFMFKVKTKWYIALHSLYTQDLNRENILIDYILNEKVDDILAQLDEGDVEIRERVELISNLVREEIKSLMSVVDGLYVDFLNMNSDRKEFALKYLKVNPLANLVFRKIKGENSYDIAVSYFGDKTKKLTTARQWLMSKSNFIFKDEIIED